MRGALRIQVLVLLALTGAVTGALAGWVGGVLWLLSPLPDATGELAVVVLLAAVLLEAVGRPRPPSIRRQVPQAWSRIFEPRTVAVLYGARLGLGPATILPTWLWWGAFVVAAACGPWVAGAGGALFALARVAATHGAVAGIRDGGAMSRRVAALRRIERPAAVGVAVVALTVALAGCGGGEEATERERPAITLTRPPTTISTTAAPPPPTSAAPLTPEVATLDAVLLDDTLPHFRRDDEAVGAGPLDLEAAARAESDVDAERALLETRGFVRGASRAWSAPEDDVVYLAVYEFGSSEGADAYLVDGAEHLDARGATRFEVPGVEGALGFTTTEPGFTGHAVTYTRGNRWFLVLLGSPGGTRTAEEVVSLAERQAG